MQAPKIALYLVALLAGLSPFSTSPEQEVEFVYTPYHYRAEVIEIYDADTLTVDIDLGLGISAKERLRLRGIDAWEVRGEEKEKGLVARDWVRSQIPIGSDVYLETQVDEKGKFGRYVVELYLKTETGWRHINKELVDLGHAETKEY